MRLPDAECNSPATAIPAIFCSRSLSSASVHPPLRGRTDLRFSSGDLLGEADVVFACMHHGESSGEIERLRTAAPVVIDLGADFRLRDAQDYPRWYGWTHPAPDLLAGAVYGLAEMHRAEIASASLIATGGCLATASIPAAFLGHLTTAPHCIISFRSRVVTPRSASYGGGGACFPYAIAKELPPVLGAEGDSFTFPF